MKKLLFLVCFALAIVLVCGCSDVESEEKNTEGSVECESETDKAVITEESYPAEESTETEDYVVTEETETTAKNETSSETSSETLSETSSKTGTNTEPETETASESVSIHNLEKGIEYTARGEEVFKFRPGNKEYYIVQGGCFDGENYYISHIKKYGDGYEDAIILVLDENGRRVRESGPLELDHANSITYIEKTDMLLVSHCHSPDDHYYRYSLVDRETLTVRETADLAYPFFAMAYSPEKDMFASGEWSGEILDLWDGDLRHIKNIGVKPPGSLSQSLFCDGEGIYFVRSSQNGYPSEIRVYDWKCRLVRTVELRFDGNYEPESITIIDGDVYIIGTDWDIRCGVVYRLVFEEK